MTAMQMRRFGWGGVAAMVALLGMASAAHSVEIANFKEGGWDISAHTSSRTGNFSNCSGYSRFEDGIDLFFTRFGDGGWTMGLAKRGWKYADNSKVRLRVSIDGRPLADGDAVVSGSDMLIADLPASMINPFRFGNSMQIVGPNFTVNLDLMGTNRLVASLMDCVARYSGDPRYAVNKPPATGGNAQPSTAAVPAPPPSGNVAAREAPPQPPKGGNTGTGFVLNAAGHIVTNDHVVKQCKEIRIQRPGDVEIEAKLVVTDSTNDLALLKSAVGIAAEETARLSNSRSVQAGARIAVYGFPLSGALSTSGNVVEGNVSALAGLANNAGFFQISAPVQPGNSGGPLLDGKGMVVGVVSSKLDEIGLAGATGSISQNVNFAIKSNVLTNFLDANSVAYEVAESGAEIELPAIAARAQRFTVLVTCKR